LIYGLTGNEEILRLADIISKKLNLKVLYINDFLKGNKYRFRNLRKIGPEEFVSLFYNASYVVTDSFHGTAFSVIFKKDFITVPHKTRGTRMISLLNLLKLDERIIKDSSQLTDNYPLYVDYNIPNQLLNNERQKSFEFLKKAIEG
jgi:hypothetical protein